MCGCIIIDHNHNDRDHSTVVDRKPEEVDKSIDYLVGHEDNDLVVEYPNNLDRYFLHSKNRILNDMGPFQTVVALDHHAEDKQDLVTVGAMYVGLDWQGH